MSSTYDGCPVVPQTEDLVPVMIDPDLPAYACRLGDMRVEHNDRVIVRTQDGVYSGWISLFTPPVVRCPKQEEPGVVLRLATGEDRRRVESLARQEKEALSYLRHHVQELDLEMRPLKVRFAIEGRTAIVYFLAERRIDFRRLVRDTARRYRRRVQMRHLGVRDGAKAIGGFGPCGRPLCCSDFMMRFQSVSVRMAKRQNLSLNPSKISGMCGRLMCCLTHELDQYPSSKRGSKGEA